MRTTTNPFTDPGQVHGPLYATADRLARRTSALHRARVSGRHAADVLTDLAAEDTGTTPAIVADLGCGRGTTTRLLAERLPRAKIVAIDMSAALLSTTRTRMPDPQQASMIRADFHSLPFPDSSLDLIVAAFCLVNEMRARVRRQAGVEQLTYKLAAGCHVAHGYRSAKPRFDVVPVVN